MALEDPLPTTAEAMQKVLEDLTRSDDSITPTAATQSIDKIVHAAIAAQIQEAKDDPARTQNVGNPDGIIWELWEQVCVSATHTREGQRLVEFLSELQKLPKHCVLQRTDWNADADADAEGERKPWEIELWTRPADIGARPLKEWLWEFDQSHFLDMADLELPTPGSTIRQQARNYNAFTARLMSSDVCHSTALDRNATLALQNALEPDRQASHVRPRMMDPDCRAGHVPAAVEWMRYAAGPIWNAVQEGRFVKKKYDKKGNEKPDLAVSGIQRWEGWKREFGEIAADERYAEEIRLLCGEAVGFMSAVDGHGAESGGH